MKTNIGKVSKMVVHHVGNKANGDGVGFGGNLIPLDDIEQDIKRLIIKSFELSDLYHFYFESTVNLNPVYSFVKNIFEDSGTFLQQSNHIAKILYECSSHPRIKEGELSVIYLQDCCLLDEKYDAVAIIKSETPQKLLQLNRNNDGITAVKASGISLSKIERGCLIFARDEDEGYQIAIVDNVKNNCESKYWKDDFLHIKSYNSPNHQTANLIEACNGFINTTIATNDKLTKVEKAMISVRAKQVLHENDSMTVDEYTEEVFQDFVLANRFKEYVTDKGFEDQITHDGTIRIDKNAIRKKKTKVETIKLDNNFDLRIYGGQELIVRGYDENAGMNYYKVFFEKEK